MKKIECYCGFSIVDTGVTGARYPNSYPWTGRNGLVLHDHDSYARARNQQRNFDTLLQIIGLRSQPLEISSPLMLDNADALPSTLIKNIPIWYFSFEIESADIWQEKGDDLALLRQDSDGVPMLTGLGESPAVGSYLCAQGPETNLYFRILADK